MLASFLCWEFLLHILSWLLFSFLFRGSFPHTSHAGLIFMQGVSLVTHPELASFLWGKFLLHILCWLLLFFLFSFYLGSFSYTSHACFIFLRGVSLSLTHSMLFSSSFLIWGVSLTHPMLASFLCGEFLLVLHNPYWLYFYLGSFSYTSHSCFVFCGEFFLHTPCWLSPSLFFFFFNVGSFS